MNLLINDLLYFPKWGAGAWYVWRRNFLYFRYTVFAALSWIFVEPLLILFAFGFGLGRFVTQIDGMNYAEFVAPAMMATTAMFVAFFEGTYGTYTKLTRQNTLHTIIITPVDPDDVAVGEIAWAATKAFLSVLAVGIVTSAFGLTPLFKLGLPLVFLALLCWVFAAFGVMLATMSKSYDWFIYYQSGFITPMSLFCGTYFPLSAMPKYFVALVYLFPLTHGLAAVRLLLAGDLHPNLILHFGYLFFVALFLTNVACSRMARKLVL